VTYVIRLLAVASFAVTFAWAAPAARAAELVLNEYNAVSSSKLLDNDASDPYFCRRPGNGGDWFELVVVADHLDARGYKLIVRNDPTDPLGGESFAMILTDDSLWSDLRSGTIVTVSEDIANNAARYQPAAGRWWINVRASPATDGRLVEVACISPACDPATLDWKVSENEWQLTIEDAAGNVVFGPAGEGVNPASGVSSTEVCKLEEAPTNATSPFSLYNDGSSSSFGAPNRFSGGAGQQDLGALRAVVPFAQLSAVRISEVLSHSDPGVDWIELHNTSAGAIDVGGWYLSDRFDDLERFRIPDGTTIAAGGYLVFDQDELDFGVSSACGDEVILSAAVAGTLTGQRDVAEFGPAATGVSFGPAEGAAEQLLHLSAATPGAPNAPPRVGPVVINEIMYHPTDLPPGSTSAAGEFVELYNAGAATAHLSTTFDSFGEHSWELGGGIAFEFALGQTIAPGGYLVVVDFDPVADAAALAEFRALYSMSGSVPVVGPYEGKLDNFRDRVALLAPDTPEPDGDICGGGPDPYVPNVVVDEVEYTDCGAWPEAADGTGASLQRIVALALGRDPGNWAGDAPATPGARNSGAATSTTLDATTTTTTTPPQPCSSDGECGWPCGRCRESTCDSRCGLPVSTGVKPSVSDSLFVLRSAVALAACAPCVCDVDGDGAVGVRDALRLLKHAVGAPATLTCSSSAS
jgi:hypothetical protein